MKTEIENKFHERLYEFEVSSDPRSWNKIQSTISRKKNNLVRASMASIIIVFLFVSLPIIEVNHQQSNQKPILSNSQKNLNIASKETKDRVKASTSDISKNYRTVLPNKSHPKESIFLPKIKETNTLSDSFSKVEKLPIIPLKANLSYLNNLKFQTVSKTIIPESNNKRKIGAALMPLLNYNEISPNYQDGVLVGDIETDPLSRVGFAIQLYYSALAHSRLTVDFGLTYEFRNTEISYNSTSISDEGYKLNKSKYKSPHHQLGISVNMRYLIRSYPKRLFFVSGLNYLLNPRDITSSVQLKIASLLNVKSTTKYRISMGPMMIYTLSPSENELLIQTKPYSFGIKMVIDKK